MQASLRGAGDAGEHVSSADRRQSRSPRRAGVDIDVENPAARTHFGKAEDDPSAGVGRGRAPHRRQPRQLHKAHSGSRILGGLYHSNGGCALRRSDLFGTLRQCRMRCAKVPGICRFGRASVGNASRNLLEGEVVSDLIWIGLMFRIIIGRWSTRTDGGSE